MMFKYLTASIETRDIYVTMNSHWDEDTPFI